MFVDFPWWHSDYSLYKREKALWSNKSKSYHITEKDDEVIVEVDVPGYQGNDLSIVYENKVLSIIGENDRRGKMELKFRVDYPGLTTDGSKASLHDGVLIVSLTRDGPKSCSIPIDDD